MFCCVVSRDGRELAKGVEDYLVIRHLPFLKFGFRTRLWFSLSTRINVVTTQNLLVRQTWGSRCRTLTMRTVGFGPRTLSCLTGWVVLTKYVLESQKTTKKKNQRWNLLLNRKGGFPFCKMRENMSCSGPTLTRCPRIYLTSVGIIGTRILPVRTPPARVVVEDSSEV